MRRLNKQGPIPAFTQFVTKNKPTQWEQLPAQISADSRLFILCIEQECLCGYSEIPLEEDSSSSHIDHYYKKYKLICSKSARKEWKRKRHKLPI